MTNVGEASTKPLGIPPNRDLSYVQLEYYVDERDVEGWIRRAEEYVRLKGYTGDEAAGYVLYHIRRGAKIELCTQVEAVVSVEQIFKILRDRGGELGSKGERLRELLERKQKSGESVMEFELFKIGIRLQDVEGWRELMGEIFRSNLIDEKVRYHLLSNTSKDAGFTELRVEAQKFVNIIVVGAEVNTSGECYRIESESGKLRQEVLDLRREVECYRAGFAQNSNSGSRVQRCYNCGRVGHSTRWCRYRGSGNGYPPQ